MFMLSSELTININEPKTYNVVSQIFVEANKSEIDILTTWWCWRSITGCLGTVSGFCGRIRSFVLGQSVFPSVSQSVSQSVSMFVYVIFYDIYFCLKQLILSIIVEHIFFEVSCCGIWWGIPLPDFIPWGTRYESVNYGISNYWFT